MTPYLSQLGLAKLLAASLLLGIGLGMLYDVFRIRRRAFKRLTARPKCRSGVRLIDAILLHTEDALFGITAGIATVLLYFALSRGQVRLMALFGEGAGFVLYRLTLGRLVTVLSDRLISLISAILRLILRWLLLPPLKLIWRLLSALGRRGIACMNGLAARHRYRIGQSEASRYAEQLQRHASEGFLQN